jgi:hypothetical protein
MKLTKISLALAAVLAVSAVAASAAMAAPESFRSTSSPVSLLGEQTTGTNLVFTLDGQKVECNKAVFEKASLSTPATSVPGVSAAYSECTAFGFMNFEVNMGTCTYTFLQPNSLVGNVGIFCGPEAGVHKPFIKIRTSFLGSVCETQISQNATNENLSKLEYKNNGSTVDVSANVSGISVNKTVDSGACPLSGTGAGTASLAGPIPGVHGLSGIGISIS